jgi:hypothetical protein
MKTKLLILLFTSLSLGGCVTDETPITPPATIVEIDCEVNIPIPRVGSKSTYQAIGQYISPNSYEYVAAWDSETEHQLRPRFTGEEELVITIGEAEPRVNHRAELEPAHRISYERNLNESSVVLFDEWINTDGALLQLHMRQVWFLGEMAKQFHYQSYTDRPAAFGSNILWGQTIGPSWEFSTEFEGGQYGPTHRMPGSGEIQASVSMIGLNENEDCEAEILLSVTWPNEENSWAKSFSEFTARYLVQDGLAWPSTINMTWVDGGQFYLENQNQMIGAGEFVVPYSGGYFMEDHLVSSPTKNGWPVDEECKFGTCLATAEFFIRGNARAAEWFLSNPDYVPYKLDHFDADPDSYYDDAWALEWQSGSNILQGIFVSITDSAGQVFINKKTAEDPMPLWHDELISIDDLAFVHEQVFGGEPEVLFCRLDFECGVNTHIGAGRPRLLSDGEGSTSTPVGAVVGLHGTMYQIDTIDPSLL